MTSTHPLAGPRRRVLGRIAAVIGALVVGRVFWMEAPRDVVIAYAIGSDHGELEEATIRYVSGDEEIKGFTRRFPDGLPAELRHTVRLSPGRYDVTAEFHGPARRRSVRRALRVPAGHVVRIDLSAEPSGGRTR